MTTALDDPAGRAVRRHRGDLILFLLHATVVAGVATLFIGVDPIGVSLGTWVEGVLTPMALLGLPWFLGLQFLPWIPWDLGLVLAAVLNVVLHGVLGRRSARPAFPAAAVIIAVPLALAGIATVQSGIAADELRQQVTDAVPGQVWRTDDVQLKHQDCAFCRPRQWSGHADQLVTPGTTEARLLAATDRNLTDLGYRADKQWDCQDRSGSGPERRVCDRHWTGRGSRLDLSVSYRSDAPDPRLVINVDRQP